MKLATFNINSVRLRLNLALRILQHYDLDVLCLQETKTVDDTFPYKAFKNVGYPYIFHRGEKSYNGVAIISRLPMEESERLLFVNNHARHIATKFENNIELHNFYVPAGGDEPDVIINPKFRHKLDYVQAMEQWFQANRGSDHPMILVGDLNIAPLEEDVWSHKQLLKVVSHTPIEVEHFNRLQSSLKWVDVPRHFIPPTEKLYSWWSYRNRDWQKSNRGRRLDHIWVTPALQDNIGRAWIDPHWRSEEKPSDHVPVLLELKP